MTSIGALVAVGRTSDVYEFGRGSVVKVPRPNVPSHWAADEARFTSAVRELGAPAPAVRAVVDIDGRDAVVFEHVRGTSLWELMVDAPQNLPALAGELAGVHHAILSAGLPLEVPGLVERIHSKISDVGQLTQDEQADAHRALDLLPRGAALLHGDLHPGNVLMTPRGPIVIDWFDAAIGHPLADVVRTSLLIRPLGVTHERPHLPGGTPEVLAALHETYVAMMGDILAGPLETLRQWEAVVAASRLAEDAEADESPLLEVWRSRHGSEPSPFLEAVSGARLDEFPE